MPRRFLLPLLVALLVACALPAAANAYVYFNYFESDTSARIARIHNDGSHYERNWLGGAGEALDLAVSGNRLVWASGGGSENKAKVSMVGVDGTDRREDVYEAPIAPQGIAFNGERLFVAGEHSEPCGIDPSSEASQVLGTRFPENLHTETLIKSECIEFEGIAATGSHVYWLGFGSGLVSGEPTITSAPVSGGSTKTVVGSSDLHDPNGLTTDGSHLFWAEKDKIVKAALKADGSVGAIEADFITGQGEISLPIVAGDELIWREEDSDKQRVKRASASDGSGVETVIAFSDVEVRYGLAASVPYPVASVTPEEGEFEPTPVATEAEDGVVVTLHSEGEAPLRGVVVSLKGPDPYDFPLDDECEYEIASLSSCEIFVAFKPSAPGPREATLTIANDVSAKPFEVKLEGKGLGPAVSVSPADLDFGEMTIPHAPETRTLTIDNSGTEPLELVGLSLEGDPAFALATGPGGACEGLSIPAGGSCAVEVSFAPSTAGRKAAVLNVAAGAPAVPESVSVGISGIGIAPLPVPTESPDAEEGGALAPPPALVCPTVRLAASATGSRGRYELGARVLTSPRSPAALTAIIRYRHRGKPRRLVLDQRRLGDPRRLGFAIPRKLRRRLHPGQSVNLLLRGRANPPGPCPAQQVHTALRLHLGR